MTKLYEWHRATLIFLTKAYGAGAITDRHK